MLYNDSGDVMKSSDKNIEYVKLDSYNFEHAYQVQKLIWDDDPDYQCFYNKAMNPSIYDTCFLVYLGADLIGITGTYIEDFDTESIWLDWFGILPEYRGNGYGETILLDTIRYCQSFDKFAYFRLDTTYWEDRPAIGLYDKVMDLKEKYTREDTEEIDHHYLIYTYNLKRTNYTKPWNNRFIGLVDYYKCCN